MIAKMIHYSFLLYHKDIEGFMTRLQELGVVDLRRIQREQSEEDRLIWNKVNQYNQAVRAIKMMEPETKPTFVLPRDAQPEALLEEWEYLLAEKESTRQDLLRISKEVVELKPWGEFPSDIFDRVQALGLSLRFFSCSKKAFHENWKDLYPLSIISSTDKTIFFVILDDASEEILINALEIKAPDISYPEKEKELRGKEKRLSEIENRLLELTLCRELFEEAQKTLLTQIDFRVAMSSADVQAENTLLFLEGYVPEDHNEALVRFLEEESVVYSSAPASKEDPAPILLKNGRFSRLFEPISKLYSLPSYGGMDLTPFFAPFFMMMFGFCLGDAGYGLIMILAATFAKKKMPAIKDILTLVQLLGAATIVFCFFTGSVFGVSLGDTETFSAWKSYFLTMDNLFPLALGVGGVQIVYGMCVKAVGRGLRFGWIHSISTFGWILLIISTVLFYFLEKPEHSLLAFFGPLHIGFVSLACLGIFFFNSPGKNPLVNVGMGMWDSYNMATGMLGDMLSYIRLFALNLSSGILGGVFNSLAFGLSPDIPVVGFFVTLLILCIGHGINLFMSALGSLVHPMRLVFVEFYKNAGFEGAGKAYRPFKIQS